MFAINAYTGGWLLAETIALCSTNERASALLADGSLARNRPGLTLVIERVQVKPAYNREKNTRQAPKIFLD